MENITTRIDTIDWEKTASEIHEKGYSIVSNVITNTQCRDLIEQYDNPEGYRKTVVMERYRFGLGEYKYFKYPLPNIIQTIRSTIYPKLVPIANLWMKILKIDIHYLETFEGLQDQCHANNQLKPTPLILKYGKGGFNTLHQDLYGDVYFPLQTLFFLNDPDIDYSRGEFIMTQQTPRTQTKAIAVKSKKGDMLIFATTFRPTKGTKGYYRMKHGASELHSGERHTLGIIFHDAVS